MRNTLFISLIISVSSVFAVITFYPWGDTDHKKRNEELLSALRGNLGLETSEQVIIDAFSNSTSGFMIKDAAENTWIAHMMIPEAENDEDEEDDLQDDIFNAQTLNQKLQSFCSILSLDYWNYEWCHHREVNQFHVEHKDRGWVKEPNWSLGRYKRSVVVRDLKTVPSPITKVCIHITTPNYC